MAVKPVARAVETADVAIGRGNLPQGQRTPRDRARDRRVVLVKIYDLL
jgi:hypothetical protein